LAAATSGVSVVRCFSELLKRLLSLADPREDWLISKLIWAQDEGDARDQFQPRSSIEFKAFGLHASSRMARKQFPGLKVDSRRLRREVSGLRQRSEEILLRLDELARQLENVTKRAVQKEASPKK
jgi:hypothetical protein